MRTLLLVFRLLPSPPRFVDADVAGVGVGTAVGFRVGWGVGLGVGTSVGLRVGWVVAGFGVSSALNVTVSINHFPGFFVSTVQRILAMPAVGAIQTPSADAFSAGLLCVIPLSLEEDLQARRAFEFDPGANGPVSSVRGDIANPTKVPPLSVTV